MSNKFGSLAVFFGALMLSCTTDTVATDHRFADDAHAVNNAMNSVVALVERDEDGFLSAPQCTAFFVGPRILTTAYHCVEIPQVESIEIMPGFVINVPIEDAEPTIGSEALFITYESHLSFIRDYDPGNEPDTHRAVVIQVDPIEDVALLRLSTEEPSFADWFPIAQRLPVVGERLYELGMPRGQFWLLTEGMASSIREFPNGRKIIVHQAHVSPGASGSPLFNNSGEVVGVTTAFARGAHYIGFATPISQVKKLIEMPLIILGEPSIRLRQNTDSVNVCENNTCALD